jgi:hypothetical protein
MATARAFTMQEGSTMASGDADNPQSRGVEFGEVLPRETLRCGGDDDTSRSETLPSRGVLVGAAGLLALAGVLAPFGAGSVIAEALTPMVAQPTAALLMGTVSLLLFVAALGLVANDLRTVEESDQTEPVEYTVPVVPDEIDLEQFSAVEVDASAAYLAGARDGCRPPRGASCGEFVIARVTDDRASKLASIPDACARLRRRKSLFPVLVAVPNAEPAVVEEVSEAYASTLLVDTDQRASIPQLLELLPYLCSERERAAIEGIGSVMLSCIELSETHPHDADLAEEIRARVGTPLAKEALRSRQQPVPEAEGDSYQREPVTERPPDITVASAPSEYLKTTIDSLPEMDDPVVAVRSDDGPEVILIARFYTEDHLSTTDDRDENTWTVRLAHEKNGQSQFAKSVHVSETDTDCHQDTGDRNTCHPGTITSASSR